MKCFFITYLFSFLVSAQIADTSFFASQKSINPGIAHLRQQGFASVDAGKKNVTKKHKVIFKNIKDGINYDLSLDKLTGFFANTFGPLGVEALIDKESGTLNQKFEDNFYNYDTNTKATSMYTGGLLNFSIIGVSIGKAKYDYDYYFSSGKVPDIVVRDYNWNYDINNLKIGTAFKVLNFTFGAFYLKESNEGKIAYTYVDSTTGNVGTTENFKTTSNLKAMGVGVGFSSKITHIEISLEKSTQNKLKKGDDFPYDLPDPKLGKRLSLVAEQKFNSVSLGIKYQQISGVYYDLEEIITNKLLFEGLGGNDKRTNMTFNFSFGKEKGLTYSGFYSQSTLKNKEKSTIVGGDDEFEAITKSQAYGVNLSYFF